MATSATVTEITGRAWVRQPDGSLNELRSGSIVSPDSEVITASGATVTLVIDGAAPITIGENRSVAITDDLFTPANPVDVAVAAPSLTDSERLLATLESGDDPFGILEATAAIAGEPGGEDGGGSFVRLRRRADALKRRRRRSGRCRAADGIHHHQRRCRQSVGIGAADRLRGEQRVQLWPNFRYRHRRHRHHHPQRPDLCLGCTDRPDNPQQQGHPDH